MGKGRKRSDGSPGVRDDPSVSRQREYARRQIAAGNCMLCGEPRQHYKDCCDGCAAKVREQRRKRSGCTRKYKRKDGT